MVDICGYIFIDQVFALTSCAYQALMSQFAKLPCLALSVADLQDSQLLATFGKYRLCAFVYPL